MGVLDAVCVVYEDLPQPRAVPFTAIDKRPVEGGVSVTKLGLEGDHVCDPKHHGGVDQAVYVYSDAEAQRWSDELGRPLPAGWFGENFRVSGIPATDAVVGTRWQVGTALFEVTSPRTPCMSFQIWAREEHWVRRFAERGDTGTYLRVLEEGVVTAGDRIDIVHTPAHGVTIRDVFRSADADRLARLLDGEPTISAKLRPRLESALERLTR
ncbi:MOSC domain-containing protein [Antrihabitans sp. YC2-6]|uniref:MOSC domain-containing protein n=1 Tax=Antrihabitans sp. YC2-6 TaxID=2799498 RepID=UPI0018F52B0E|nr:MOSC domain-containing protein [Antrihabitans sp. YC2-6]MBJ8344547.1 MOSC domain-containing protein [Antrihabitans sp. YC2-6]